MTRKQRDELDRKLARFHQRALEPCNGLELERLTELIEDLEFQLLAGALMPEPAHDEIPAQTPSVCTGIMLNRELRSRLAIQLNRIRACAPRPSRQSD